MKLTNLLFFISLFSFAQNKQKIFIQPQRYDEMIRDKIENDNRFQEVFIAYTAHVDPSKTDKVDLTVFIEYLNRVFPSKEQSGYLCIDLENQLYSDLKKYPHDSKEFLNAEKKFISLLTTVKKLRPNLKVGFYGLPHKIVSSNDSFSSINNKLRNIIKKSDVLFPSLYLSYSEKQYRGEKRNSTLINNNLENALAVGLKYKKPVIPFIWYRIHPANKSYGGNILTVAEMENYVSKILEFQHQKTQVSGIVYWEPNTRSFASYKNLISNKKIQSPNTLFRYYWYNESLK